MEKDDVTTEDNIFDIEIPQDDASPDTDLLKYLANILITQAEVCNLARQVVDSIMPGLTNNANLGMVKFMPLNQEGDYLYARIQNAGNHVPAIAMVGNDDTYEYLINIIPDYGGMPSSETEPAEMPKGAGASLIRTLKEGDRKSLGSMIFQRIPGMKKHAWNTQALRKNSSISFTDAGIHIHRMQCLSLWQETALEAFLITILICFMKKTDKYLRLQIKQGCLRQCHGRWMKEIKSSSARLQQMQRMDLQ